MDIGQLLDRLQQYYDKPYNAVQMQDVKKYLESKNITDDIAQWIYDKITKSEKFLPKVNELENILDDKRFIIPELHEQSPHNIFLQFENAPAKTIIGIFKKIREKHFKDENLKSKVISFLVEWDLVHSVYQSHIEGGAGHDIALSKAELAKDRMIKGESHAKILDDLFLKKSERKRIDIQPDRIGLQSMANVMKEIKL